MKLPVRLDGDTLFIGDRFTASFQRTLRVPDDDRDYPLPPGLGPLPLVSAEHCGDRLPPSMRGTGKFVLPMYQREALWLAFGGAYWKPNAVKVGVGSVNAVTGAGWDDALHDDPQDYLVCPGQPWLDGFVVGEDRIRQFVAMPLGLGHTVEEQLSSAGPVGGIRLLVYEPKPGRFPDDPPPTTAGAGQPWAMADSTMGMGAGGTIRQRLYVDQYGFGTWDMEQSGHAMIHILNSRQFLEVTGQDPPPTPVDARVYTEHGLPWFTLYDHEEALASSDKLQRVRSIAELDNEEPDPSIEVDPRQIKGLRRDDR